MQQRLQSEKEQHHQERLQKLQEQEQQFQFEDQVLQKEQLLQNFELEKEARRRNAGAKRAEIQLTDDLSESANENKLKGTFSQLSAASCGAESQRLTDWLPNGSVDNSNQSRLNVAAADPSACASVYPTPLSFV